jgi:hypothetical protein
MTLNNLAHLTRIQSKRNRTSYINLLANTNIIGKVIRVAGFGVAIILDRVLEDNIPVFGGGSK